jgi:hypothetical protein
MADFKGKRNPNYKTGLMIKGNQERGLYNSWQNMKARCLRKSHPKYDRYGGRGIAVCDEWLGIEGFYKWAIASGWKPGFSIDRIDNDGDYEPHNCRWISMSENSRKKRTTKITFEQAAQIRARVANGESAYKLAKEFGVVHGTVWFIINNFIHVAAGECAKKIKARGF